MKKFFITQSLIASAALAFTPVVFASDSNFYAGLSVGNTQYSADGPAPGSTFAPGQEFSGSDTNFGIHVGYNFNRWFAMELDYSDYGSASHKFRLKDGIVFIVKPNDTQEIEARGATLLARFNYEFTPAFSAYGLLGVAAMNYDNTMSGGFSEVTGSLLEHHSSSGQGLAFGVGTNYALSDDVGLRLEARRSRAGDVDLDTVNLGFDYHF